MAETMTRSSLVLIALLSLLPSSVVAQPDGSTRIGSDAGVADDGRPVKVVRVRDLLLQAVQHYQRSEFDRARRLLEEILEYIGDEKTKAAQRAHQYMAFVHVAYGETDRAVAAFERALAIDPEMSLPSSAPKIAAAFEQARSRYRARVQAMDHDPPVIRHAPPNKPVRYGRTVTIAAEARDVSGVKQLILSYRVAGNRGYSTVVFEPDARGRYIATIPALAVVRPGVQYYVEAWDKVGNGPGLKGSARAPITIKVEGGPATRTEAPGPTPWYKRWWVWAAVAGVVATAGGISAAAYLSREETASFNVRFPNGLDPASKR
jgi:hypothetical protein